VSATPEPERHVANESHERPTRLTRIQQLTLNTWRRASARVTLDVSPNDVLAQVAIYASLAVLRNTSDPVRLFARHETRAEEFALVTSLAHERSREALHDLLDSAFLLRWLEVTSNGRGPEELPPLSPRPFGHQPLLP
jgi:hypothetical protein